MSFCVSFCGPWFFLCNLKRVFFKWVRNCWGKVYLNTIFPQSYHHIKPARREVQKRFKSFIFLYLYILLKENISLAWYLYSSIWLYILISYIKTLALIIISIICNSKCMKYFSLLIRNGIYVKVRGALQALDLRFLLF